jgi:hypothetical protein
MKNLFLFIAFIGSTAIAKSQGNLQFNQVLNFVPGSNYTVPADKVLKIESVTVNSGSTVCLPLANSFIASCGGFANQWVSNYSSVTFLTLGNMIYSTNGASNVCGLASCYSVAITFPSLSVPIWLNGGKTISVYNNMTQLLITAIEFNIIP